MTAQTESLTAKIQQNNSAVLNGVTSTVSTAPKRITIEEEFQKQMKAMESQIIKALPREMSIDRLCRVFLSLIKENRDLMNIFKSNPHSIWGAVLLAAQLGLDATKSLGQCYVIPYAGAAQFQIGYRGLLELLYRRGDVVSVQSDIVRRKDFLKIDLGLKNEFVHTPYLEGDRGEVVLVYAIFRMRSGESHLEWMTRSDIERIEGIAKSKSIWKEHWDEMAKKTVIKRASKYLPLSTEIRRCIEADEVVKKNITEDMIDISKGESIYDIEEVEKVVS